MKYKCVPHLYLSHMFPGPGQSWTGDCTPKSRGHPLHLLCGVQSCPIPKLGVCDTLRNRGTAEGHAGSAAPGCRQRLEQAWREQGHASKDRESCVSSSPCGWDGPGDKHFVTGSSINPSRLCLHNTECFSCFMEVDRNSTGTKGPGPG